MSLEQSPESSLGFTSIEVAAFTGAVDRLLGKTEASAVTRQLPDLRTVQLARDLDMADGSTTYSVLIYQPLYSRRFGAHERTVMDAAQFAYTIAANGDTSDLRVRHLSWLCLPEADGGMSYRPSVSVNDVRALARRRKQLFADLMTQLDWLEPLRTTDDMLGLISRMLLCDATAKGSARSERGEAQAAVVEFENRLVNVSIIMRPSGEAVGMIALQELAGIEQRGEVRLVPETQVLLASGRPISVVEELVMETWDPAGAVWSRRAEPLDAGGPHPLSGSKARAYTPEDDGFFDRLQTFIDSRLDWR